jgi:hypothetical protein
LKKSQWNKLFFNNQINATTQSRIIKEGDTLDNNAIIRIYGRLIGGSKYPFDEVKVFENQQTMYWGNKESQECNRVIKASKKYFLGWLRRELAGKLQVDWIKIEEAQHSKLKFRTYYEDAMCTVSQFSLLQRGIKPDPLKFHISKERDQEIVTSMCRTEMNLEITGKLFDKMMIYGTRIQ